MILIAFGLVMGLLGGMLGIGGAVVLIPMMTFYKGENQHLYQAAAMICIFFVSSASLIAHKKAKALSRQTLIRMVPGALVGIVAGVALSNSPLFEGQNDYLLARVFGGFLAYVAIYNGIRLFRSLRQESPAAEEPLPPEQKPNTLLTGALGLITGTASGLLGIGAGTVATPLQQLCLKSPMRRAMGNSATLIVCVSWLGAIYKNATLAEHGIDFVDSFKIAICIIPGAIIGGFFGGHLMHTLPKNIVRIVFIVVCVIAAAKLLTVSPT
ncbi:MAG: sulfite exporter TauE/SafE family protein [Planctomycetota bacterium]|jgi:uncharacterized membrane protein YfcA